MVYSLFRTAQVAPVYRWPFQQDYTHGCTEFLSSRLRICYVKDVYTERWYLCKYWIQFLGICTQCSYPLIDMLQVLTYHQNHKSITSQLIIIRWYQPNSCAHVQSIQVLIGCVAHMTVTWHYNTATTQLPGNPWSLQVWAWQRTPSCWSQSQCCLPSFDHQSSPAHRERKRIQFDCLVQTRLFGTILKISQVHLMGLLRQLVSLP